MKLSWGYKLTIAYIGFVLMIGTCVGIAFTSDFDLVEEDYYAKEIAYQDRIDAIKRTNVLEQKPEIKVEEGNFLVDLNMDGTIGSASIKFYHPQEKSKDKEWEWENSRQYALGLVQDMRGKRKVQVEWEANGLTYYYEKLMYFK